MENEAILTKEEAQSEALAITRLTEPLFDTVKRGLASQVRNATKAGVKADRDLILQQLELIDDLTDVEKIRYVSAYLDGMREDDPRGYQLTVDVHEQTALLDLLTAGAEQTDKLIAEFNHERQVVSDEWDRKARQVGGSVWVADSAIVGEAINKLAQRPSLKHLPTEAFGQLFAITIAQRNLAEYVGYYPSTNPA